jgi:hypothetical protein
MSTIDFKALGAKAAAEGADQTKTVAGGGGDYEPPKAGRCNLRFVGYVELGKRKGSYMGKPNLQDKVEVVFELSGKNHPPTILDDGTKVPIRITIEENLSMGDKARFPKLFNRMNYKGDAQHMVQLLGEAYIGDVIHRKYAKKGEDKSMPETWTGIAAELFNKADGLYTVRPPRFEVLDEEGQPTGEVKVIPVDAPLTVPKGFLWQYADKEMWDSLYIEGEYPERKNEKGEVTAPAKSKNVWQNKIKQAANFKGSPVYEVIAQAGGNRDIPDVDVPEEVEDEAAEAIQKAAAEPTPTGQAADDALNGVA